MDGQGSTSTLGPAEIGRDGTLASCPECGGRELHCVSDGELTNFFCVACRCCWHLELGWVHRIDPTSCPGCTYQAQCRTSRAPHRTRPEDATNRPYPATGAEVAPALGEVTAIGGELMPSSREGQADETPTVEVRVYRDGHLVHLELCESDEDAALVVEQWNEIEGTECEVDDLSSSHRANQILDLEPPEPPDEEAHRREQEVDAGHDRTG